jgi:hypothetical protein
MSDRFLQLILYFIAGLAALFFVMAISIIILRSLQEAGTQSRSGEVRNCSRTKLAGNTQPSDFKIGADA